MTIAWNNNGFSELKLMSAAFPLQIFRACFLTFILSCIWYPPCSLMTFSLNLCFPFLHIFSLPSLFLLVQFERRRQSQYFSSFMMNASRPLVNAVMKNKMSHQFSYGETSFTDARNSDYIQMEVNSQRGLFKKIHLLGC